MATLAKLLLFVIALGFAAVAAVRVRKDQVTYSIPGAALGALIIILAFAVMPSFGYIPVGHRGVVIGPNGVVTYQTTTGEQVGRVLGEGFYFLVPFLFNVEVMSVRTESYKAEKLESASSDMQIVTTDVVINYRIRPDNASKVYQDLGRDWQAKVFNPAVIDALKASTARFPAEALIQQRPAVSAAIRSALEERGRIFGFEIQAISITQFDFSPEFNKAIEAKATATQQAETARRNVERVRAEQEAEILRYQADAKKNQLALEAAAAGQRAQLQYITPQLIELRNAEARLEFAKNIKEWRPEWITGELLNMFFNVTPPSGR